MFRISSEQKIYHIGEIRVGGQPGENPPVLIGSMFHKGDRLIQGRKEGRFDREGALALLRKQGELSKHTGIPAMIDLVANSGEEFRAYIDFVAENTDAPLAIDAWKMEPKLSAARYAREQGLLNRLLYNSLTPWAEDLTREVESLKEIGVKHVVLVAFDMEDKMPSGRLKSLGKLLKALEGLPLESLWVDTSTMNLPAQGFCGLANREIKTRYGLPTGSAPANGTYVWKKAREIWGPPGFAAVDASLHALSVLLWHDFLFYGPLAAAPRIFPAVAAATSVLSTLAYAETGTLPGKEHPFFKFFADFAAQLGGSHG